MNIEFVWDEEKNIANIRKHGVDFNDAVRAYYDPFRQDIFDEQHSSQEGPGGFIWDLLTVWFFLWLRQSQTGIPSGLFQPARP
ncbi:MAG: BrnT family toxin [Spirochaetales bacterium]|jgi:hypothetical protein|nr:BrnT family toxin [Spirochaetales bacterium]